MMFIFGRYHANLLITLLFSGQCNKINWTNEAASLYNVSQFVVSKGFICKICRKSFERKGHLQDHANSHTGKRPYACTFCAKGFTQKGNCKRHIVACPSRLSNTAFNMQ